MRRLVPLLVFLAAAAPAPAYMTVMAVPFSVPSTETARPAFQPAPVPNQDAVAPTHVDAAKPEFGPTLFSAGKKDTFRGDGFTSNSTEQVAEERNYKPGGGFALKMPLQ